MARVELKNLTETYDQIEHAIRAGEIQQARALLAETGSLALLKKLPMTDLVRHVRFLRRTGQPLEALKIISPKLAVKRMTETHRALWLEYADCMTRFNAVTTSMRILNLPELREGALVPLYRAFAHMHSWAYAEAEAELKKFLRSSTQSDYNHWIGQVNLLACQIALDQFTLAAKTLPELEEHLKKFGYRRLLYNVYELKVQLLTLSGEQGKIKQVNQSIQHLELKGLGAIDELYLLKWKAVHLLGENKAKGLAELRSLRRRAAGNSYSELARDLDYNVAVVCQDERLLRHLFFGTPHAGFRNKPALTHAFPAEKPNKTYLLKLSSTQTSPSGGASVKKTPAHGLSQEALRADCTPLTFRLLSALLVDFYRTPNIVELFERTYPDAYFNPESSPLMIHQLLHRFREQEQAGRGRFEVIFADSTYQLLSKDSQCLELSQPFWQSIHQTNIESNALAAIENFGAQFTAVELAQALNQPLRTTQLHLKQLTEDGIVRRLGHARRTVYELIEKTKLTT
jgi:DNA-binding transcriptional ArsR family regulator